MIRVLLLVIGVLVGVWRLPVQDTQPTAFADPSFARVYSRSTTQQQTLLWGNGPLVSVVEPYTGAPGNRRLVQYFDRGRMERAEGTDAADGLITQGLLVLEMATGNVQIGEDAYVQGEPAQIPLLNAADSGTQESLTYADFARVVRERAEDRTQADDTALDAWIAPGGKVTQAPPPALVHAARYDVATGHNIPSVTAAWLDSRPFGVLTPVEALGLPISEPFWIESGMGRQGVSLVQLFERRVVVYTPDLPKAERFSLTNVGRHYYRWRYGTEPVPGKTAQQRAIVPIADKTANLTLPDGYRATILRRDLKDVFDIAIAPDGRIALGRNDGSISLFDPDDPDNTPAAPLVDHLANPVTFTWVDNDLYVVDDTGLHRYRDRNADGQADNREDIISDAFARESVVMTTGLDGALYFGARNSGNASIASSLYDLNQLLRISANEAADVQELPDVDHGGINAFLVDTKGAVWTVDTSGEVVRFDRRSGERENLLDASELGDDVRDLLLYRPDGASGDPLTDMLVLTTDADGSHGRIVRLQLSSGAAAGAAQPGAIVDFITGLDRPVAMAAGLDGSLYILDAGPGVIYRIHPP